MGFPLLWRIVAAGVYASGTIGIQGLDQPAVFLLQDIFRIAVLSVQKVCGREMLQHKFLFFLRQQRQGRFFPDDFEQPFVVDDLGAESADDADVLVPHGFQKRLNLCHIFTDIRGDGPAVDGVYGLPRGRAETVILPGQLCDLTDFTGNAGFFKAALEFLEFRDGSVFQKIHDGYVRMGNLLLIGAVNIQKGLYPGIIELILAEPIPLFHFLMGRIQFQGLVQHIILVHGAGAVGVDFAEAEGTVFFIIEDIEPGDGQQAVVEPGRQNQLFQLRRKGKELPVCRIVQIFPDDFLKNVVSDGDDLFILSGSFRGKNLRDLQGAHAAAVVGHGGMLQIIPGSESGAAVFFKVFFNDLLVLFSYCFHNTPFSLLCVFECSAGRAADRGPLRRPDVLRPDPEDSIGIPEQACRREFLHNPGQTVPVRRFGWLPLYEAGVPEALPAHGA